MVSFSESNRLKNFIEALDPDPEKAGERLIVLREKLAKLAVWRGCAESAIDEIVDITIDRIMAKSSGGVEIENLNAYASQVLRFVVLEHGRKNKEDAAGDDLPEIAVQPVFETGDQPEVRLGCLQKCLFTDVTNENDRRLILEYYQLSDGEKLSENRRQLARRLGVTTLNLKVKACRIRDRLERCIGRCVEVEGKRPV